MVDLSQKTLKTPSNNHTKALPIQNF
ncbi:hypothetical protein JIP1600_1660003 [Flavobacterium psychrophilum]|nr:hypothetical protein JIP1600_1660003 [Flavobacterium psychrophilum]